VELFRNPFEVFHDQPAEGRLDVPVRKVEQKRRNEENDRKTVVLRRQLGTAGKNLALHLEQAVDDRRRPCDGEPLGVVEPIRREVRIVSDIYVFCVSVEKKCVKLFQLF